MPVVSVRLWDLFRLMGAQLEEGSLSRLLEGLKLEVDSLEGGTLTYDAPHDRPDLYSAEGLARALAYQLGTRRPAKYPVARSGFYVDSGAAPRYRPHVLMTVVRGVELDDEAISQLFQLQEKLHVTHCGNRELVSIGLYDLDTLSPPLYYREVDTAAFRPLGYDRVMEAREVLRETEKGREYGHLVEEGRYPLLVDSRGTVLSLPPIVNSEDTRVTEKTRNVLIDVTGTEPYLMASILAVVTTSVYERGAKTIEVVPVVGGAVTEEPLADALLGKKILVTAERAIGLIGVDLDFARALSDLRKHGYVVESSTEERAVVWVPPYRVDVIDEDDIIEDVAISMDYNRISGLIEPPRSRGVEHPLERTSRRLRDALVGLGFMEVLNFMLTDPDYLRALGYAEFVEVENPKMRTYSALRPSLLPGILKSLSNNVRKYELRSLRIFEIGDVVDPKSLATVRMASGAIYGAGTTLTDGLAALRTLLEVLGLRARFRRTGGVPLTIEERSAAVEVDGVVAGIVGEVHPRYLKHLRLSSPVTVFEVSVNGIAELLGAASPRCQPC